MPAQYVNNKIIFRSSIVESLFYRGFCVRCVCQFRHPGSRGKQLLAKADLNNPGFAIAVSAVQRCATATKLEPVLPLKRNGPNVLCVCKFPNPAACVQNY
jgi:hypothetical protein